VVGRRGAQAKKFSRQTQEGIEMEKITNQELRQMAQEALENWDFTLRDCSDDDWDCSDENQYTVATEAGLKALAMPGDYEQEVIDGRFAGATSRNKWDILEEWAHYLGQG
jgi:hypothetical protein